MSVCWPTMDGMHLMLTGYHGAVPPAAGCSGMGSHLAGNDVGNDVGKLRCGEQRCRQSQVCARRCGQRMEQAAAGERYASQCTR